MIKSIGIYVNGYKDIDYKITAKVISILSRLHIKAVFLSKTANILDLSGVETVQDFIAQSDCILVLGGDGTVLYIISDAALAGKPVLSVNLGRLGFLSELEIEELEWGLEALVKGDYTIEERMMLECHSDGAIYYALNDVCLQRQRAAHLLHLKVFAGDFLIDHFSADGVLVSSPTGSTAYSLSAGGPILDSRLNALLITPVCAHTLRARPILLCDDEIVKVFTHNPADASLMIDGKDICLNANSKFITISKAKINAKFIRMKKTNFYQLLNSKLNEWNTVEEETYEDK